jgi:hypothetical protein
MVVCEDAFSETLGRETGVFEGVGNRSRPPVKNDEPARRFGAHGARLPGDGLIEVKLRSRFALFSVVGRCLIGIRSKAIWG